MARRVTWFAMGVVVALAGAACGPASGTAPAARTHPAGSLPAGMVPTAVAFWTARRGLIGGVIPDRGSAPFSCQPRCLGSLVAETLDGGQTWRVVWRGGGRLVALTAAGQHRAWQTFRRCPDVARCTGTAESSDAGRTWHVIANPDRGPFADPCGHRAWATIAVVRPTVERAWALCTTSIGGTGHIGRAILETQDAGRHWRVVTNAPFNSGSHGMSSYGDPEGIDFLADGHGWLWQGPRGVSMATTDGGASWHPLGLGTSDATWVTSGWFVSPRAGFALLTDPGSGWITLERTTTGGARWSAVHRWRIPGLS